MASALLGAPAVHADVTDDVAGITSDVEAVTQAATEALPSAPVPIETPGVPKVPPPPSPPSKPPSRAPSPPPAAVTEPVENTVRDIDAGAGQAARTPSEAEGPVAGAGPGSGGETDPPAVARGPDRRSVGQAETASPLRWRAYVWPAIALRVGDSVRPLLASVDDLVGIHLPEVFGLFSSSAVPGSAGIDRPAKRSGLLGRELQSPSALALPEGGMGLLAALLIGLLLTVGLVALARLVVGEELFEGRYWRDHRG